MGEYLSEPPPEKANRGLVSTIKFGETKNFFAEGVDSINSERKIMYFSIKCTNPNGAVEIVANIFDARDNGSVDKGRTSHSAGSDGKILNSIPFRLSSQNGGAHIVFL